MAIDGDLVALIAAGFLEIYARDSCASSSPRGYRHISRIRLPSLIVDAVVKFIAPTGIANYDQDTRSRMLRICITSAQGLCVYDVYVSFEASQATMHSIWSREPCHSEDTLPSFGKRPQTLSWCSIRWTTTWSHMAFSTAMLTPLSPSPSPSQGSPPSPLSGVAVYEVSGPSIPALHYMGVRDYDEFMGTLVLGNACGELAVFDVSGQYLSHIVTYLPRMQWHLESSRELLSMVCLSPFRVFQCSSGVLTPQNPIKAHAAPPYPCSVLGPGIKTSPGSDIRDAAVAQWKTKQLPAAPAPWTTKLYDSRDDHVPWWSYVPCVGRNLAWILERRDHFLGTITPLLFRDHDLSSVMIFKAGGLLFAHFEDADVVHVLDHGITATEAARLIDNPRFEDYVAHSVQINAVPFQESCRYLALWEWEQCQFGRNRWTEFKARGGQTDPEWLTTPCSVR